jgi:putative tributyrin esterase
MFGSIEISDPALEREGVRQVTVLSPALRRRGDVTLYVPPAAAERRDIPVVILLHGMYASHWSWTGKGEAHRIAARMIAEGTIPPLVLAMPSDGLWGNGSGYVPHADHDPAAWIVDEVPAVAAIACPAVSAKSPICIAGLSMGGFGALRLAALYPNRFIAAAGHSVVPDTAGMLRFSPDTREGWSTIPADCSILGAIDAATSPPPPIRFDCGLEDGLIADNRYLSAELEARGIPHNFTAQASGHDWAYWRAHLPDTLRFFADALRWKAEPVQHG